MSALAQKQPTLSNEVIVPHDAAGNAYIPHGDAFEVRFSNPSDQPIVVWEESCEPEHRTLSFQVTESGRETSVVQKRTVPVTTWTNFPAKTVTIPSKKTCSRKVRLSGFFWGEREWVNVPEPNTGERIEIRADFEIKPTAESANQGVWTGRIESAVLSAPVLNPKLSTPQEYLWDNCPRQALKMLKDDPTWIHKKDRDQCTPLHHAARFGYQQVVVWLIENGADINATAYNGFTPLHLAERKDITELLLKAGANREQKDSWGKTALQHAVETRRPEVADAIVASGSKVNLYTALLLKKRDLALKMLISDSDLIVGGDGGADLGGNTTPLGWAAGNGDIELAKLLLEAGAPINDPTDCIRYGGYATPLCNAVWTGKVEMVEFLLKKGAATNVVGGKFVRSITDYAAQYSDKRIVELLKSYGTNPSLEYMSRELPKVRNKLPSRIASGAFKLPADNQQK